MQCEANFVRALFCQTKCMAAKPSPTKSDPASSPTRGGFCHAVERLPQPRRTGNEAKDRENADRHKLFLQMTQGLIDEPDDIIPVYTTWQGRKCIHEEKSSDDVFDKISTLGKLEPSFQIFFISQRTSVLVTVITALKGKEDDNLPRLITFETGIACAIRLPVEVKIREVMLSVLTEQAEHMGNRLQRLASSGLLNIATGELDWRKRVNTLVFRENLLTTIIHIGGDSADIPDSFKYTKQAAMINSNWSDAEAMLVQEPYDPKAIHTFFDADNGPNALRTIIPGKEHSKMWVGMCKRHHETYQQAKGALSTTQITAESMDVLHQMQTDKNKNKGSQITAECTGEDCSQEAEDVGAVCKQSS